MRLQYSDGGLCVTDLCNTVIQWLGVWGILTLCGGYSMKTKSHSIQLPLDMIFMAPEDCLQLSDGCTNYCMVLIKFISEAEVMQSLMSETKASCSVPHITISQD